MVTIEKHLSNIKLAKENLTWIIEQMEAADKIGREKLADQGVYVDGELGYIFHLKRVLELL